MRGHRSPLAALVTTIFNLKRDHATVEECEISYNCFTLSLLKSGWERHMDNPANGTPRWLTIDLTVIAISLVIIAIGIWIGL